MGRKRMKDAQGIALMQEATALRAYVEKGKPDAISWVGEGGQELAMFCLDSLGMHINVHSFNGLESLSASGTRALRLMMAGLTGLHR